MLPGIAEGVSSLVLDRGYPKRAVGGPGGSGRYARCSSGGRSGSGPAEGGDDGVERVLGLLVGGERTPSPKMARPPESSSTSAMAFAAANGLRINAVARPVPRLIRSVVFDAIPRIMKGSR